MKPRTVTFDSAVVVVGKPVNRMTVLPQTTIKAQPTINWNDFNYPPLLNLVHFEPAELPPKARSIAHCLNLLFLLVTAVCTMNLLHTGLIVFTSNAPRWWLLQSALHVILIPGFAFLVFYVGERGLAEQDRTLLGRYMCGQMIFGAMSGLMSLAHYGCINGFFKLKDIDDLVGNAPAPAFVMAVIVESALWMACTAMVVANTFMMRRYDRNADTPEARKSAVDV